MARRTFAGLLLLSLWGAAAGRGPLLAQGVSSPGAALPFPIDHGRPEAGGLLMGPSTLFPGPATAEPVSDLAAEAFDPVTRPWAQPLARLLDPGALPAPEIAPLDEGRQDWLSEELPLLPGRSMHRQTDSVFGSVTAEVTWRDPREVRDAPSLDSAWKTGHSWQLPLAGPVFVFGKFDAVSAQAMADELKMQGKTGVGCKIPVPFGIDVQLSGGRSLTYGDPLVPRAERTEVFVELKCRCPLPGQLALEYQGLALPGLTPLVPDRISQDLGLALPVCDGGKLRLGARHDWESNPAPRTWADGVQLYVGFELGTGTSKQ
jgi:hypothetical protein